MGGPTPSVRRVDTADRRSALADRLTEYHDWMERMVRSETDASYDATANVADDLRDVGTPRRPVGRGSPIVATPTPPAAGCSTA